MGAGSCCKDGLLRLSWIKRKGRLRMAKDGLSESGQETECTLKRKTLRRV